MPLSSKRNIVDKIEEWAMERHLHTCLPRDQFKKFEDEYLELQEAIEKLSNLTSKDGENKTSRIRREVMDAIGDIQVVLIVICTQLGLDYDQCLWLAYNEIKDRKGKIIDGIFVKEE